MLFVGYLPSRYRGVVLHPPGVACRSCWMPGSNEDLGCPRKYFSFVPQNFLRPFFSHSPKFFTFSHQLSHFRKIGSLDAPLSAASCTVTTFFSSLCSIYLHFF